MGPSCNIELGPNASRFVSSPWLNLQNVMRNPECIAL